MSSMFDDQIVIGVLHDYSRDLGWMAGRNDVTRVRGEGLLAYIYMIHFIFYTNIPESNICRSVFGDERIVTSRYRLIPSTVDNSNYDCTGES